MTQSLLAARLAPLRWSAFVAGLAGSGLCAVAYYRRPADFFAAWAWLTWWSISAGALAIAMIHHLKWRPVVTGDPPDSCRPEIRDTMSAWVSFGPTGRIR